MSSTPIFCYIQMICSLAEFIWSTKVKAVRTSKGFLPVHCLTTIHICSERTFVQVVLSVLGKTNMSLRSNEDHSRVVSKSLPYHVKLALGLAATASKPPPPPVTGWQTTVSLSPSLTGADFLKTPTLVLLLNMWLLLFQTHLLPTCVSSWYGPVSQSLSRPCPKH